MPLMKRVGVKDEDMSPFCKKSSSRKELLQAYVAYCPRTFSYDDFTGAAEEEKESSECARHVEDTDDRQAIVERIHNFATEMLADKEVQTKAGREARARAADEVEAIDDSKEVTAANDGKEVVIVKPTADNEVVVYCWCS